MGIATQRQKQLKSAHTSYGRGTQKKKMRTLLPQFRLSLLHGRDDHVANTSVGETIQACTEAIRFDKVKRLGAAVVRAIEHGTGRETEG